MARPQEFIEKNAILLVVLTLITISIGGIVSSPATCMNCRRLTTEARLSGKKR